MNRIIPKVVWLCVVTDEYRRLRDLLALGSFGKDHVP